MATGALNAAKAALDQKGKRSGWVDHALAEYKMVRSAIQKKGDLDKSISVEDACTLLDEKITQREATKREQDRSWQPRDSRVLDLMSKKIVKPLLSVALMAEDAQAAISVANKPEPEPEPKIKADE